tara:strand:+ start:70 stop:219 length:150 start_codon:yes stop_codon:yes gene_type:complete
VVVQVNIRILYMTQRLDWLKVGKLERQEMLAVLVDRCQMHREEVIQDKL